MKQRALGIGALLWVALGTAGSQPIYRCGDAYGHTPCEGGRAVRADDARTTTERTASEEVTRRSEASATALQREREAAEDRARIRPVIAAAKPASSSADKTVGKTAQKKKSRKKPGQVEAEFFTSANTSGPAVPKKTVKLKKD